MLRKTIIYLIIAIIITFGLPFLVVRFTHGDMGTLFLLFFGINPIISICYGIIAGLKIRVNWFLPILLSILFLFGFRLRFSWGNLDFLIYAVIYLVIGYVAAGITFLLSKKKNK